MATNPQSTHPLGLSPNSLPQSKVYTESERAYALAVYAETRSPTAVYRQTGIPESTIREWASSEEGQNAIASLRGIIRERCAWGYVEQMMVAHQLLMERLRNGDPVVLTDGRVVYRGVSARDLMMVMAVSQDKHASLVGQLESGQHVDKALNSLANKLMEKLAQAKGSPEPKAQPLSDDASDYVG